MTPTPFALTPVDGYIQIAAAYTPTLHVHEPESTYCRYFWLPELGPSSYLSWSTLAAWLPADDGSINIAYNELAYGLGTAPGRLSKALARLAAFHLGHVDSTQPSTFFIKRRAPQLNTKQLIRLVERCPTLAACHDEHLHTAA